MTKVGTTIKIKTEIDKFLSDLSKTKMSYCKAAIKGICDNSTIDGDLPYCKFKDIDIDENGLCKDFKRRD